MEELVFEDKQSDNPIYDNRYPSLRLSNFQNRFVKR